MAINISPENARLFEDNGYNYDSVKQTVDYYRSQNLSDEEIQDKINTRLKQFSQTSEQTPQEDIQNNKQIQTPQPDINTSPQSSYDPRNGLIGKTVINALPFIGGVGGAIAGGGIASIPTAGLGAAAGEGLKQRILMQQGEQQEFDPQTVLTTGIGGAVGQAAGLGTGAILERLLPQLGRVAGINPEIYKYSMQTLKKGGNQAKNNWIINETMKGLRPLKQSNISDTIGELGVAEALGELAFHAAPGVGASGGYILKKLLEAPALHKQLLRAYGTSTRIPIGGGVGGQFINNP